VSKITIISGKRQSGSTTKALKAMLEAAGPNLQTTPIRIVVRHKEMIDIVRQLLFKAAAELGDVVVLVLRRHPNLIIEARSQARYLTELNSELLLDKQLVVLDDFPVKLLRFLPEWTHILDTRVFISYSSDTELHKHRATAIHSKHQS